MEHLLRATARAEARHFWFRGFRRFVRPLVETALAGCSAPAILDCGCGTGANVELLAAYGRTFGFDASETGLRLGRARGRVVRADVAAVPFPGGAFDLVTSFDVLYSLAPDVEGSAVREMWRVTRPGGHLIVNVAAMNVLRGDHSVLSRERRRYSRRTLRALLAGAGFEVRRLTYTNAALFLPLVLARSWQRLRGLAAEGESEREITPPPAPVNAALTAVLAAESWWLRRFDSPFGSSLLCLARKPAGGPAA
ncbi:MAG TPA: class I SAM-dependent methyltransferase [Vicinamibacterales bacterium]|jgi:SAM-dependent methyltransferase|nr:class I SAM-dependent methyltransferase [Vicinamibacterales bacterium]